MIIKTKYILYALSILIILTAIIRLVFNFGDRNDVIYMILILGMICLIQAKLFDLEEVNYPSLKEGACR